MIAELALAVMLAAQPLRSVDSGVDHGNRLGLLDAAPFSCHPNDEAAACLADDNSDDL